VGWRRVGVRWLSTLDFELSSPNTIFWSNSEVDGKLAHLRMSKRLSAEQVEKIVAALKGIGSIKVWACNSGVVVSIQRGILSGNRFQMIHGEVRAQAWIIALALPRQWLTTIGRADDLGTITSAFELVGVKDEVDAGIWLAKHENRIA
jgi:hypothetical protein